MKENEQGFSLLEVACIIVLMGLVGLAAVPSFQHIKRKEAEQFITQMCMNISAEHYKTQTNTGQKYILELTPDGAGGYGGYTITKDGDASPLITETAVRNLKVEITGIQMDGTSSAGLSKITIMNGKLQDDSSNEYKRLEMDIKVDGYERKASIEAETGYYELT